MLEDVVHRARTHEDIAEVVALAHEIWNEHFPAIIGQEQVDYMLDRFQSNDSIGRQIQADGYEYYLVGDAGDRAGYFAVHEDADSVQLSKLYLRRSARRRGTGARIIRWVAAECRARGVSRIWLTVNKDNASSIAFYRRMGFEVESAMVTDIGDGFAMDDYLMVRGVQPDSP